MTPNGFYGLSIRMQRSNRTEVSSCHIYWISTEKHWISSVNSRRLIRLISEMAEVTAPFRPFRSSLVALASHLLAANGTHQCWTSLLGATFFTEIQVQGEESKLQVVSMFHVIYNSMVNHVIQKGILWSSFKIDHKENEAIGICIPSNPNLACKFWKTTDRCKPHGFETMKVSEGRIAAALDCYITHIPSHFKIGNGQLSTLPMQTLPLMTSVYTWHGVCQTRAPIMLHLPNVTGTFSPAVCVGLDYLDWQGESGCHKPCCLHILQLKMGRMRQHPQDLGRPVAHCCQESDKWRTNFGILQLVY